MLRLGQNIAAFGQWGDTMHTVVKPGMTEILHMPIFPTIPQLEMEAGNPVSPLMTIEPSLKWPISICSLPLSLPSTTMT